MAQYFNDCTSLDAWAEADWTAGTQWAIEDGQITGSATNNGHEILRLTEVEADANRNNVEIYGEFERVISGTYREVAAILGTAGTNDGDTGVCYMWSMTTGGIRIARATTPNARTTVATQTGLSHTSEARYRYRFRRNGTSLRLRVWLAADAEPSTWGIDTTDSTISAAGYVGPITPDANTDGGVHFAFGVGTNGDEAPTGPVSSGLPTLTGVTISNITGSGWRATVTAA